MIGTQLSITHLQYLKTTLYRRKLLKKGGINWVPSKRRNIRPTTRRSNRNTSRNLKISFGIYRQRNWKYSDPSWRTEKRKSMTTVQMKIVIAPRKTSKRRTIHPKETRVIHRPIKPISHTNFISFLQSFWFSFLHVPFIFFYFYFFIFFSQKKETKWWNSLSASIYIMELYVVPALVVHSSRFHY